MNHLEYYFICFVILLTIFQSWYFIPALIPLIGFMTFRLDSQQLILETDVTLTQFANNLKSSPLFYKYKITENSGIILVSAHYNKINLDWEFFQTSFLSRYLVLEIKKRNNNIELNLRLPISNFLFSFVGVLFLTYLFLFIFGEPNIFFVCALVVYILMLIELISIGIAFWNSDKLLNTISNQLKNTYRKI